MKKLRLLLLGLLFTVGIAWGTVESVTYISDLNITLPASGDARSEGDDHLRNLKIALKNTFPNISGAVTPTHTQLNFVTGVTSAIQTQLDGKAASGSSGMTLLSSVTLTNTATTVDFTSSIDSTYDEYELRVINAVPVTNNQGVAIRTSADAGSTWDSAGNYDYVFTLANNSAISAVSSGAANQITLVANGASSTALNGGVSAVIRISDPASASTYKRFTWNYSSAGGVSGTAPQMFNGTGSGNHNSSAAITGLRVIPTSGNWASGKFKLYGIKK